MKIIFRYVIFLLDTPKCVYVGVHVFMCVCVWDWFTLISQTRRHF